MDERHPKRRKDKNNPYTLSVVSGRFYLSFRDGMGVLHEMEIDGDLYSPHRKFPSPAKARSAVGFRTSSAH